MRHGIVLVKEAFDTTTNDMTTGTVSSAGTLAGWFVMVKDGAGRFPGNKLWGDGWGWSGFDAANPQKTTSTDHTTDCQSCLYAGNAAGMEPVRDLMPGAMGSFDYHDQEWPEQVRAITRGHGVAAAVNAARGGAASAIRAVADGGRLANITQDSPSQ